MASQWFYQVMGEQVGPISSAELRNLAQRRTISIETPIANTAKGPWLPAERVKGSLCRTEWKCAPTRR